MSVFAGLGVLEVCMTTAKRVGAIRVGFKYRSVGSNATRIGSL